VGGSRPRLDERCGDAPPRAGEELRVRPVPKPELEKFERLLAAA
jgi:hypothetical protein